MTPSQGATAASADLTTIATITNDKEITTMWITELPQCRARRLIRSGVPMERKFWTDSEAPHLYRDDFPSPDLIASVTIESNGVALIGKRFYTEHGVPLVHAVPWLPHEVIALVTADGPGDRLILPGGYLQAHAGTDHQVWSAFRSTPGGDEFLAEGVSVAEGRKLIARNA